MLAISTKVSIFHEFANPAIKPGFYFQQQIYLSLAFLMMEWLFYTACAFVVLRFMLLKLELISLVWLYHTQRTTDEKKGISVIICARNEAANLTAHLHLILQQEYPLFEVIVVNDASTDDTGKILDHMASQYPLLKVVHLTHKDQPGKKPALRAGIRQASYDFLLLTDADCEPLSPQWLHGYSRYLTSQHPVVIGYGAYRKQPGMLNRLIRFDTAYIAISYLHKALWGYPYMAVGRNMGYSKKLAEMVSVPHSEMASGDDDLFIQALKGRIPVSVILEKNYHTSSLPKTTFKEWMNQKGRHSTTGTVYHTSTKLWLGLEWLIRLGVYISCISLFFAYSYQQALGLLFLNLCTLLLMKSIWMIKLGEKDLILFIPILDFIYIFVQPAFVIAGLRRKKTEWS